MNNMESCFPPIAGLSLRGKSGAKSQKNRHSTGDQRHHDNNVHHQQQKELMPKIEILQDLDLYYIRQIASSLKVNTNTYTNKKLYVCFVSKYICRIPRIPHPFPL